MRGAREPLNVASQRTEVQIPRYARDDKCLSRMNKVNGPVRRPVLLLFCSLHRE